MQHPYIFPPVGPVLRFPKAYRQSCTVVVLNTHPRQYWWPLLQRFSTKVQKLAVSGNSQALLLSLKEGWSSESGIPGNMWAFQIVFHKSSQFVCGGGCSSNVLNWNRINPWNVVSVSQNKEFSLPSVYKPVLCKYKVWYLKRIKSVLIDYKCLVLFSSYYLPIGRQVVYTFR